MFDEEKNENINRVVEETTEDTISDFEEVQVEEADAFESVEENILESEKSDETSHREYQSETVRVGDTTTQFEESTSQSGGKKKSGIGKKIVAIIASAALFGVVAGGTMVGITKLAGSDMSSYIAESETQAETKVAVLGEEEEDTSDSPAVASNALALDVSAIVKSAMPSVVAISGTTQVQTQNWFGQSQSYEAESAGSGIIIGETDTELLIVTNNHVIEDTDTLSVTFIDGSEVSASVKGGDSENDVAVIAVSLEDISSETLGEIAVANIGDSDSLEVGQGVIAIGNALGYGQSVTVGYVSALDREVQTDSTTTRNLLQTDAAINPGNSGGALLNMKGEVIGINSAKYSSTEVEGMGYAIPISTVKELIAELSSKQTRTLVEEDKQGYLGIQGQNIDEQVSATYDMPVGIYVYKIVEDGAAANSTLQAKDIITKFDGQTVETMEDLKKLLTYYASGTTVDLTVQRLNGSEYEEVTVTVTLGSRESIQVQ